MASNVFELAMLRQVLHFFLIWKNAFPQVDARETRRIYRIFIASENNYMGKPNIKMGTNIKMKHIIFKNNSTQKIKSIHFVSWKNEFTVIESFNIRENWISRDKTFFRISRKIEQHISWFDGV